MGRQIVSLLDSTGGGGGSLPPKVILVPADFPTTLEAYADVGRVYIMGANVTDNDPTKTNTGQSFLSGDEAVWDGVTPVGSYFKLGANALWLDDGTDYKTISPARNLDLQNKDLKNVANAAIGNLSLTGNTITTSSGDLNLNSFSNDIHMQNARPSTLQFPVGSQVSEILTAMPGSPNDSQLLTALAIKNAISVEDLWDRATGATNYLEPHTDTGDTLHLNDEESTLFSTADLQIFRNDTPDINLWAATALANSDANLNLIRSRGTIASPSGVIDGDLIGNINVVGYDGTAFRNGGEIRFEINGAVSAGVLPCDMVFYVNAGAGVATEGMRLVKDKTLEVIGYVQADSVKINDTNDSNTLDIFWGDDDTSDRTLAFLVNSGNRRVSVVADTSLDQDYTTNASVRFGELTIDNLNINGNTVSSTSGDVDITSVADINIKSTSATGVISWLKDTGLPAFSYNNNTNQFIFSDDIAVAIGGVIEVNTINNNGSIFGVTIEGVQLLSDNIKADKISGLTSATSIDIDKLTIDTTSVGFTTISSSDITNVITIDGAASSAILRLDRGATNQNGTLEYHTASVNKWMAGLIANEGDDDYHLEGAGLWFTLNQAAGEAYFPAVYADTISTATKVLSIDSAGQIGESTTSSPTFAQVTVDSIVLNAAAITITENSTDFTFECKRTTPGDGTDLYITGADAVNNGASPDGGDVTLSTGAGVAGGVAGELYLQMGGVTKASVTDNYFESTGYMLQAGIFAEIYVADASTAQLIPTGATYTKSTAFTTDGLSSNCTAAAASDKITLTKLGQYRAVCSVSATSGTANVLWRCTAFLNGVEQDQCHWKRKMATNTDSGAMSFDGLIDVTSVPVDLDLRLRHDNGGDINFTIEYANLNVEYMGAT